MSEDTLEVLIGYNVEIGIPDRAFCTMIEIIEEYGNSNYLNEAAMAEIVTTTMMLWQEGCHIKKAINDALRKLGYNKLGSNHKQFNEDEYYDGRIR